MRFIALHSGIIVLSLTLFVADATGRDLDQDEALRLRREDKILPLEQMVQQALGRYPGATLLEVELEEENEIYVYEVELLTKEGQVRELEMDAHDGRLLKDEED
jgi:uncharacterized membrane protein YkoI